MSYANLGLTVSRKKKSQQIPKVLMKIGYIFLKSAAYHSDFASILVRPFLVENQVQYWLIKTKPRDYYIPLCSQ